MPHRTAALILLALALPARGAEAPACAAETQKHARAACLEAAADRLILAMNTRVAGLTMALGAEGVVGLAPYAEGLRSAQERWRRGMEADCARLTAPDRDRARLARQRCRLEEAELRAFRLEYVLTTTFAPGSLAGTWFSPEIEIILPPGGRPRPRLRLAPSQSR